MAPESFAPVLLHPAPSVHRGRGERRTKADVERGSSAAFALASLATAGVWPTAAHTFFLPEFASMPSTLLRPRHVALVLLLSAPAVATVILKQTIEEMAAAAPLIAQVRIGTVQASWDDGHRSIRTHAEASLVTSLKGRLPKTFLLKQPGGVVGPIGQHVDGVASFRQGEEAVVFLEPAVDEPGAYVVYAMAAGKVAFAPNRLGEVRAVRQLDGLAWFAGPGKAEGIERLGGPEDLGSPLEFLTRLRQALAGKGGAR